MPKEERKHRKMFALDPRLLQALMFFGRDSQRSLDDLADEALRDFLKKYKRPVTLKAALQASTRNVPANDPGVVMRKAKPRKI